ncbi:MAG: alkaline phosphatase [Candidatus Aminicenantes bacterium]|nr:alkaline phosphatase [Candidatus Aminicenantes bacterium]
MNKKARIIKKTAVILSVFVLFLSIFSCAQKERDSYAESPKYVFLFIGDGMGLSQIHAAEIMQGALSGKEVKIHKLSFTQFPGTGLMTTFSSSSYITDSAASGTAMASGHKTVNGRINRDETNRVEFKTIAEMAKEKGMKVGIISNVPLNHATPACFYARVPHRQNYYKIAQQMIESGFDFFGGGGLYYPTGRKGLQTDILEIAREKGYTVIQSEQEFLSLGKKNKEDRVIALNEKLTSDDAMPYQIDADGRGLSLVDYVDKSIELLDNDKGFFMMVEGGEIDWAAHDHDAATVIGEVIGFDRAVLRAVRFYNERPDETLIIVTADHETGGMSLGSEFSGYSQSLEVLRGQTMSLEKFNDIYVKPYKSGTDKEEWKLDDLMPLIQENFGLKGLTGKDIEELNRSFREPKNGIFIQKIVEILDRKAGISWGTEAHTAAPVPVFSIGKGYEQFIGYYDNTDLFDKMAGAMGIYQLEISGDM